METNKALEEPQRIWKRKDYTLIYLEDEYQREDPDDLQEYIRADVANKDGDGWRPIREAKKDGTRILIPDNGGTVVYWERDKTQNQNRKAAWTNGYFDSHYEENYVFSPKVFRDLDLPQPPKPGEE